MEGSSPIDLLYCLLPGTLVVLTALVLDRFLRRWFDPVPWIAWGVFSASILLLLAPVLFGGWILLPLDNLRGSAPFTHLAATDPHGNPLQGDLIQLVAPSLDAARDEVHAGRWPLWNPRAGAGLPLWTDPQAQPLQPLALPALVLPFLAAFGAVAALRLLTAQLFFFLLLRRQGLGFPAALTGGLAYGLGGFLLLWLGWPIANTAALLPAVLYAAARCTAEDGGPGRDFLLLTTATAALLLAGHPETIAYALGSVLAFLGLRICSLPRLRLAVFRKAAGALLLAGLVTAPVLLPTALYLPTTARAALMVEPGSESGEAHSGLQALVPTLAPNAFGNSRYAHYWGPGNSNEDASAFVGTAALLAALLALPGLFHRRRRLPQEALFLAVAMVSAAAIAEPGWLGGGVHGFGRLRLLLVFAVAYLAACTVERFRRGDGPHPAWVVGITVGLAAAHLAIYRAFPNPQDPTVLEVLRHGWLLWHLRFLGGAAGLLVLGWVLQRRRLATRFGRLRHAGALFAVGLPLLVAAELFLAHRDINPPMPRHLAFPETPALTFLQDHLAPGERFAALGGTLPPNLAQLYDLPDARIYNPVEPLALRRKMAPITVYPAGEVPHLTVADHPLYDELNVAYLLTEPEWTPPPGVDLERVHAGPDAQVYRRSTERARLFWSPEGGPLGFVLPIISGSGAHFAWGLDFERPFPVAVALYRGTTLAGDGWRVLINGRRASLLPGTPWVSFSVPAGAARVDLVYRPPGLFLGWLLAALGVAWAVSRTVVLNRPPAPPESSSSVDGADPRSPCAADPPSPSRRPGGPAGDLPG